MNLLPIVIAVLLVLAWASNAFQEKHLSFRKLQTVFFSLKSAERACHQKSLLRKFKEIAGAHPKKEKRKKGDPTKKEKIKKLDIHFINPDCAKINLFPLLRDGRRLNPHLEAIAKSTLNAFYSSILTKEEIEHFFTNLLKAIEVQQNQKKPLSLETLVFENQSMQGAYYTLLKGMRDPDLFEDTRFPSFKDYFKIDPNSSGVCILHANPHVLIPFFGRKDSLKISHHLGQKKNCPATTLEEILLASGNPSLRMLSEDTLKLIALSHPKGIKNTSSELSGSDGEISIRRPL